MPATPSWVLTRHRNGRIIKLTTTGRLATPAMVRALVARDGGCAFPGCARPPRLCDAHHVTWWSRGGPTTTDNLVLLCSTHHGLIHTETWHVRMRDGHPEFRPPDRQNWTRNSLTDATARTRRIATAMRRSVETHDPPGWAAPMTT